ncbi:MAG: hypothetical protein RL113_567 [Pseudomonadota bacterium]
MKFLTTFSLGVVLACNSAYADALKNNLTNMLQEKETPAMVNLNQLNLNATPKKPKTRSSNTVIGMVNGKKIIKKEADGYLKERTQGKVTDFDILPAKQRKQLVQELALPMVVLDAAKKELSKEEQESVYGRAWMQKQARKITISDDEVIGVYNQLKKDYEENNASMNIPPFDKIKNSLKAQMVEKRVIGTLMKDVKITIK